MKMPWYSSTYRTEPDLKTSPPLRRRFHPTRISTSTTTGPFASSTNPSPSFRQHLHQPSSYNFGQQRRTYHNLHRRDSSDSNSSGTESLNSSSSSLYNSPFRQQRRAMDAATERLLARADALTERLHKLLAKSADLRFGSSLGRPTGSATTAPPPRPPPPQRPDIFSSRMSHRHHAAASSTNPSSPSPAPAPAPANAPNASVNTPKVDPDVRPHSTASSSSSTPRVHVINITLSNSCGTATAHHYRSTCSTSSAPPRRPPVVRIIPIRIETAVDDNTSEDEGVDIQQIDESESEGSLSQPSTPAAESFSNTSSIYHPPTNPDVEEESIPDSTLPAEAPLPSNQASSMTEHQSRLLALTISLAEEKKTEGNTYYKMRDYRKALICYTRAIELCPRCVAYYGNRSACRMMLGQWTEALEDARESVRLDSTFSKGYVRIAKCCLAMGDTAAALNAVNKALELDPNGTDLATEKASILALGRLTEDIDKAYAKGDYRRAIFSCDRALEHATASRRFKLTKAECLALLGRYAEAEEMANDVLRSEATNADALLVRGLCYYYQDNVDRAFLHFKQVLLMAPDHAKARDVFRRAKLLKAKKEEGNVAFKAGQFQVAHDLYTETLSVDPLNKLTNAKVHFNRAVVLVKMNRLEEALADCDRAIALDESYLKAYLRRAKIHMDMSQFEEAVRDYEKVTKMDKSREYKKLLHDAKIELKKSQRKDYYKILGVERNANDEEIKKAYKKRALVHHPDRHSSASEEEKKEQEKKFKELGEAYGILSDPKKKSRYDNGHDLEDMDAGGYADVDPNQIFQAFFGGPGMFRMGGHHGMGGMGGHGMGGHCPSGFNFQFG